MESIYPVFDKLVPGVSGSLLFWILIGVITIITALLFRKFKSAENSQGVEKFIHDFSNDILVGVTINDEVDGHIPIDYLCLTDIGIYVVDIKDFRGLLFGGDKTEQWTQVIGNRSYKFDNPLFQNKARVHAIKAMLDDDVPVLSCVIFTNAGTFPKDKPEGVYLQEKLAEDLIIKRTGDMPKNYQTVWDHLKSAIN